jgi:hypothetical protein
MKFPYSGLQASADRLLTRFNESPFEVIRKGGVMFSGEYIESAESTFSAVGVIVPREKTKINNTAIQIGDLIITIRRDFVPLMSDIFVIDGGRYNVVNIENFKPSVTELCYRVIVRK